jgi:ankyrin repeat protein
VADAAKRGDAAAVTKLLKQGADVSAAHPDGMTPLHWAAERGDTAIADALIHAGANLSAVTRLGQYTRAASAARSGSGGVVRSLVKAGAPVAALTSSGSAALHLAAASGNVESVKRAARRGRGRQYQGHGKRPGAARLRGVAGPPGVIKALIKRGANVNLATKPVDLQQMQATDRTAAGVRRQVLTCDGARGASRPRASSRRRFRRSVSSTPRARLPPQPAAAAGCAGGARRRSRRRLVVARARWRSGGRSLTQPRRAQAPAARFGGGGGGGQAAIDALNTEGPAVSGNMRGGMTPLHHAARIGFTAAVPVLLDAGADINQKSADGNSPLLVALINGQFDLAMQLVEKGANVNSPATSTASRRCGRRSTRGGSRARASRSRRKWTTRRRPISTS